MKKEVGRTYRRVEAGSLRRARFLKLPAPLFNNFFYSCNLITKRPSLMAPRLGLFENTSGGSLAELVLTLLITVPFVVLLLDTGKVIWAYTELTNIAREGARYAMLQGPTVPDVETRLASYFSDKVVPSSGLAKYFQFPEAFATRQFDFHVYLSRDADTGARVCDVGPEGLSAGDVVSLDVRIRLPHFSAVLPGDDDALTTSISYRSLHPFPCFDAARPPGNSEECYGNSTFST